MKNRNLKTQSSYGRKRTLEYMIVESRSKCGIALLGSEWYMVSGYVGYILERDYYKQHSTEKLFQRMDSHPLWSGFF